MKKKCDLLRNPSFILNLVGSIFFHIPNSWVSLSFLSFPIKLVSSHHCFFKQCCRLNCLKLFPDSDLFLLDKSCQTFNVHLFLIGFSNNFEILSIHFGISVIEVGLTHHYTSIFNSRQLLYLNRGTVYLAC